MNRSLIFFIGFILNTITHQGQNGVFYYKDDNNIYTENTIHNVQFKKAEGTVLDTYCNCSFWFKIPKTSSKEKYVFDVNSVYVKTALGYQNKFPINQLKGQRFTAFEFNRSTDVYIKVKPIFKMYFPFKLMEKQTYFLRENRAILFNGFYYGFSILVILYSIVYYLSFKDITYLHYAFLLISITIGLFVIDGSFTHFSIGLSGVKYTNIINYIALALFSSTFMTSFLFLEGVFPKLKYYAYSTVILIGTLAIFYLITDYHTSYIILGLIVFSLFLTYWLVCILFLFRNFYVKILIVAFSLLIFSVFDSFVLTNFGSSILSNNNTMMKIGAIIQIVVLWFAVIAREKELRENNAKMKGEILEFSKNINTKTPAKTMDLLETLSLREKEIFQLISQGFSNKDIALELHISVNTVKFHIKKIYDKLQVNSRKEVLKYDLK